MPSLGRAGHVAIKAALCVLILTSVCLAPLFSLAQQPADACTVLPHAEVPEGDRPTVADVRAAGVPVDVAPVYTLPTGTTPPQTRCSAIDLYYGSEPDHVHKARSCVLAQLGLLQRDVAPARAKAVQSLAAGGSTVPDDIDSNDGLVLAMIYGNGEGVERNLPLARQFICSYSDGIESASPAEHLQEFNKLMADGGRFSLCTEKGSSYGRSADYVCLGIQIRKMAKEVQEQEAAVDAATAPALKPSFRALTKSWKDFHDSYGLMSQTVCDGGTGCGPITEADDLAMMRAWLAALKSIRGGSPPAAGASAAAFQGLDRQLNGKYRDDLAQFKTGCEGCSESIRQADRDWLVYRDAWVRYGTQRWPATPADQWRAWQTSAWADLLP